MRRVIANELRRFLRQQDGATAIEYAFIAAGVAAAIVVSVNALGVKVTNMWSAVSSAL